MDLTRKTAFFEGWPWFKLDNLGLTLGTNLKFYTILSKGLKIKVYTNTQRIVLLKLSLMHVHLKGAAMLYSSFVCTHSICQRCIYNMSKYVSPI